MPSNLRLANGHFSSGSHNGSQQFKQLGIEVDNLTPQLAEQLGVKAEYGVAITNVAADSPAAHGRTKRRHGALRKSTARRSTASTISKGACRRTVSIVVCCSWCIRPKARG